MIVAIWRKSISSLYTILGLEPCQGEEQHLVSRFTRKNAFKSFPYSQPFLIHKYNDNRIDNNMLLLGLEQTRSFLLEYIHNIEYIGHGQKWTLKLEFSEIKNRFSKKIPICLIATICKGGKKNIYKKKTSKTNIEQLSWVNIYVSVP